MFSVRLFQGTHAEAASETTERKPLPPLVGEALTAAAHVVHGEAERIVEGHARELRRAFADLQRTVVQHISAVAPWSLRTPTRL